jgi:dihydropteroate synthase
LVEHQLDTLVVTSSSLVPSTILDLQELNCLVNLVPSTILDLQELNLFLMPKIFRILNLTPDSFSDGDVDSYDTKYVINKAQALIDKGADVIDIGAESTRPGANLISEEEEWLRLKNFLERYDLDIPLSLDSRNASTIAKALELNPRLMFINDVSGMQNPKILQVLANFCGDALKYVAMHSKGIPPLRSSEVPDDYYKDTGGLEEHMLKFFDQTITMMHNYGLDTRRLILDPGLGFGKNLKQSFQILEILPKLKSEFRLEILLGPSRKSFLKLWKNNPEAGNAELDEYTREFCGLLDAHNVDYLRVH